MRAVKRKTKLLAKVTIHKSFAHCTVCVRDTLSRSPICCLIPATINHDLETTQNHMTNIRHQDSIFLISFYNLICPECSSQAHRSRSLCEICFALQHPMSSSRKCQRRGFPLLVGSFRKHIRPYSLPDRFTNNEALNAEQSRLAAKIRPGDCNLLYSNICVYNISVLFSLM